MISKLLFKRHRFPPKTILLAVRWYCRYPLSYRDVRDLLAERGIHVDPATINRWVIKFGPVIANKTKKVHYPRAMVWQVDETYIRVGGKWRYLWRIVDQEGRFVDFRLTARRDAKAARAFLAAARRRCGLYPPAVIVTDRAPTYRSIISSMENHSYSGEPVKHIDVKGCNNRIESDHAALKRIINPGKGFQSLRTAKATLSAVEAFRTIKRGDVFEHTLNSGTEIQLMNEMFGI